MLHSIVLRRVIAFVRLGRPLFLGGGFVLFALGAVVARASGHAIDASRYALGQAAVTAFQLMTHYANDYYDYECDRANHTPTAWSGGSRVLPNAELPREAAWIASIVLALIGTAFALVIGGTAQWLFFAMLALAWAYSAPPLRLCARGLGELDTALVVTGLVPMTSFYLHAGHVSGVLVATLVPLALLQIAMLLAIEFPDAAGDAATDKRTLVVRLGRARSVMLYGAITAAAFAWLPIAFALGVPGRVVGLAALALPVAIWRIARAGADSVGNYERLAFASVAMLIGTSVLELVGWIVA